MAVKSKTGTEETTKLNGKVLGKRSVAQIIKQYHETDSAVELELSNAEIMSLIDVGSDIEERRRAIDKEVKAEVEPIKDILLQLGQANKKKNMEGHRGKCTIGPSTKTLTGTATQLAALLKKEGKVKLFDSLLTVRVTDAKKFLGEDILFKSKFFTSERKEYSTVSLKSKE